MRNRINSRDSIQFVSVEVLIFRKEGKLNLVCDFCGKTFRYTSVLRRHVLNDHTEVRMFKCERCDFETNNKDNYLGEANTPPITQIQLPAIFLILSLLDRSKEAVLLHIQDLSFIRLPKCIWSFYSPAASFSAESGNANTVACVCPSFSYGITLYRPFNGSSTTTRNPSDATIATPDS